MLVAAGLALAAAAREAGLLRLPLPQAGRQVPERWRFERPLALWATGYGAGLGAGFFTFQPVATYWVACAGAFALAEPVPAALCLSLYGAGRALMIVWPRRRAGDPTAAVERLTSRRGALLRVNVAALVACAVLLGLAPVAGGATLVAQNAYDPTVDAGSLAYATRGGDVVIKPKGGGPDVVVPGASQPSLSGEHLAYRDGEGIKVIRWTDSLDPVAQIDNVRASYPALAWPLVAFVRRDASHRRLVVRNLETGAHKVHVSAKAAYELGRPALRGGRLAWHIATRRQSRIMLKFLSSGAKRVVAKSRIGFLHDVSLGSTRITWISGRSGASHVMLGWIRTGKSRRTLGSLRTRTREHWTTALASRAAYATRWTHASGASSIYRTRF